MNQLDWGNIEEPNTEQLEAVQEKQYETNIDFLKTFSTPAGKRVMEWLTSHTLDTPTWWPNADYDKAVANGFFREGQNSLIRQLKAMIQQAKDFQERHK